MGTDDVFTRKDKKLGTGISDDFSMEHDGTDSKLVNITGNTYIHTTTATKKTIIDNNVLNNQLVIDHDNDRIGMGIAAPLFCLHSQKTGDNCAILAERSSGAQAYLAATSTVARMGAASAHPLEIFSNATAKMYIAANGDTKIPAAFTTIIGGTNIDLHIDSTGLIGPLPSFLDSKENIRPLTDQDTSWIYDIPVKMCDYKDGTLNQITVIAEDAELVRPDVIRYTPFEITESCPILINRTEYKGIEEIHELILPGEEKDIELDKIVIDPTGNETTEKITKRIKLLPITVNKSDFIYPMLHELQKKNLVIEDLLSRVNALELIAGITEITIPKTIKKKGLFSRKSKK